MTAACFKDEATIGAQITTCGKGANTPGGAGNAGRFNPLLQSYSGSTLAQNDIVVGLAAKLSTFNDASTGKQITTTQITARAAAWAELHVAQWLKAAYTAELTYVGDVA
jgi:hypothetical protein